VNPVASAGFGKLATTYERGRPSYPDDAMALLARELDIGPGRHVLDLAAGTGKLTRLLVVLGADVIAVEPVDGMRDQFVANVANVAGIDVLDGVAEAIPLDDERRPYETKVRALVAHFSSPFGLPYDTHVYWCSKRPA
jgi:predicted RNA methylase